MLGGVTLVDRVIFRCVGIGLLALVRFAPELIFGTSCAGKKRVATTNSASPAQQKYLE